MGYYSDFFLMVPEYARDRVEEMAKGRKEILRAQRGECNAKWYTFEEDLSDFSKLLPGVLITLGVLGEDEESPTFYYFRNGYQVAP